MRRFRNGVLALAFLLAFPLAAGHSAAAATYTSILMDSDSGQVLAEMNPDTITYPASLTKVMTLYVTFEELRAGRLTLDSKLVASDHAAGQSPSKLGLKTGESITVEQLILGIVTKSANDAASVLAEGVSGSESAFAQRLTRTAQKLGMSATQFRNASGLPDPEQVTTARDMAVMARAVIRDFPEYYPYFSTETFKFKGLVHHNHNKLLKTYPGMDGLKTGYIRASGFNLIATAARDGRRLIGVIMGGRSPAARNVQMKQLLNAGFLKQTTRLAALDGKPSPAAGAELQAAAAPTAQPVPQSSDVASNANPDMKPAAATAAAKLPTADPRWGIQVGAFSRFVTAHLAATRAARNAPRLLSRSKVTIDTAGKGGDTVYRARLMGLSESRARKACEVLTAKKFDCLTIAANGGIATALTEQGDTGDSGQ